MIFHRTLTNFLLLSLLVQQSLFAQGINRPNNIVNDNEPETEIVLTSLNELSPKQDKDSIPFESLKTFVDVFDTIKKYYVVEVSNQELIDNAIKGMLTRLDPHSLYMNEDEYHDFTMINEGEYAGIGVVLDIKAGSMQVVSAIEGSPADKVGLKSGDIISQVNGQNVADLTLSETSQLMAGEVGTVVNITVLRDNQVQEYQFTREIITTNSVSSSMLDKTYAVIRITQFQEDTPQALQKEIEALLVKYQLDGIIIDLRSNPGGLLNAAIESSDLFLNKGLILTIRGRNEQDVEVFEAQAGDILTGTAIVILVDQGTASTAEIMTAALRDNQRAIVIGQPTFGKGSVQTVTPLYHGGAVKMTTARYFTPSGESIQAQGIIPQVLLAPLNVVIDESKNVENLRETALPNYLRNPNANTLSIQSALQDKDLPTTDFALYEALNILKTISLLNPKHPNHPTNTSIESEKEINNETNNSTNADTNQILDEEDERSLINTNAS